MNPKPESAPARPTGTEPSHTEPTPSEPTAAGRSAAQQEPAPALPAAARGGSAPSIELRLTRRWLLALAAALVLVSLAALAGGTRAVFGLRDSAQNREQLAAIHGELIRIRQILETEPDSGDDNVQAEQTARLTLSGQPSLGSPNAPVVMVEFTDFQCPFCSRFHSQTFPLIRKAYVESGRVRYVTLDFPLTTIHAEALQAARASHCGEEQGRYWETHEALFSQRGQLGRGNLLTVAKGLGLNVQRFAVCLDNRANDERIQRDMSQGRTIGISGTPTFILGRPSGRTVVGRVVIGAQPYEVFDDLIRNMLDRS
jgi:protein-disulfide isomerase